MEESFEFAKDLFGLDQAQVRLYEVILRRTVLVMAALAICAVSAADARHRTDTQAPPPRRPGQRPPADTGMIPLTVAEMKRLFNTTTASAPSLPHAAHWSIWRRRHQAHARWFHQRARLATAKTHSSAHEWRTEPGRPTDLAHPPTVLNISAIRLVKPPPAQWQDRCGKWQLHLFIRIAA
ncbi:MAG TPA: hypothetical protein VM347_09935 [Nonomuraea sp.]|nr:hypothetical protein [Nonomuraea sp.]